MARLEIELGRVKNQTRNTSDTANTAVERLTTGLAKSILKLGGRSRKQETPLPLTSTYFLAGSPVPYLSSHDLGDTDAEQIDKSLTSALAISFIPRSVIYIMLRNYCEMYRPRYPTIEESELYEAFERVCNNAEPSEFYFFCIYITLAISVCIRPAINMLLVNIPADEHSYAPR